MKEEFMKEIEAYHNEISSQYGGIGHDFGKLFTSKTRTIAQYLRLTKTITYDLEQVAFAGVKRVVLHEFAHHIQYSRFGYTQHDFLFCLINQMLNCKHLNADAFNIRLYDIQDEHVLKMEKINFFFIAGEVAQMAQLPFPDAINNCKALQIALLGEKNIEDFDYEDEANIYRKRLNLYEINTTTN